MARTAAGFVRRVLSAILRVVARLFFRQIQIAGEENVPMREGVIFAMNHPNGLVDPLLLLCFAPRPVSFLAKAPLFRYPLISIFVKGLDSIPVYRKSDNVAGTNEETFARARDVLARGGSIAIFPEGTTHSDPKLKELRTGTARIALGAAASELRIVPAGIYYTEKETFRSRVLIVFGAPIRVEPQSVQEPPRDDVERLTGEIQRGLDAVTLQAESHAVLDLIMRAEMIFSGGESGDLAYQLEMRRRFVSGYRYLSERDPDRIAEFIARIERFEAALANAGLSLESLMSQTGFVARAIVAFALLPLAVAGAALHVLPYAIIALIARLARENEMRATVKIVAAIVFYPLMWAAYFFVHPWLAVIAPILGYIAVRDFEELAVVFGHLRAQTADSQRLLDERTAIRADFAAIADEMALERI